MIFQELKNRFLFVHTQATIGEEDSTPISHSLLTEACHVSQVRGRTLGQLRSANDLKI